MYQNPRRSYYSRSRGTRSFIEGMLKKIKDLGVEIITDVKKASFNPCASEIYFVDEKIGNYTIKYDTLISGLGAVGLAKLLGLELRVNDRPLPHTMFHLAMSKPAQADCFYFYGFESKSSIYRVTNYDAFCPRPPEALSRITIEALGALESNNTLECILEELENLGVIEIKNIKFSATEKIPSGFPSPTVRNFVGMQKLADHLIDILPKNIHLGGAGHGNGQFFQNEVIPHMYKIIAEA